ncbi:GH36 C-terminal domain-containing protein, partial [Streptococcus pneumoniae]|uniref:GH36 C-terminal domain-containing protein n=1 Tax=Streptococcus pneumoniae TaxID=1313 RepID=UPI001D1767BF
FYKKYRSLLQYGDFYRINSPFSCDSASWQVVSKDKCQSILLYAQLNSKLNPGYTRVYFSGLDKDKCYSVSGFPFTTGNKGEHTKISLLTSDDKVKYFDKGIGTVADSPSVISYDISGQGFEKFETYIGIDQSA